MSAARCTYGRDAGHALWCPAIDPKQKALRAGEEYVVAAEDLHRAALEFGASAVAMAKAQANGTKTVVPASDYIADGEVFEAARSRFYKAHAAWVHAAADVVRGKA